MNDNYWTPIKHQPTSDSKMYNTEQQLRSGDWLCANCKNVNFSFRKKCNRCKTQTKKKNQTRSVYSYYYCNKGNQETRSGEQKNSSEFSKQNQSDRSVKYQYKTPLHHHSAINTKTPEKNNQKNITKKQDGLPSVSPLVKKYREKEHHTTLEKISSFEIEQNTQKCLNQIQVRDFDDILNEDKLIKNKDKQISKLQKMMRTPQIQLKLRKYTSCNIQNRNESQQESVELSQMDLYMLQMEQIIGRIII